MALAVGLFASSPLPASGEAPPQPLPQELRGPLAEIDSVSARNGYVTKSRNVFHDGIPVAYAAYEGGGANGFARGVAHVDWRTGDDVVYSASFLLPGGFHDRIQGQVDIMRWDNWPTHPGDADWGGISIWEGDRMARLLRFGANKPDEDVIGEPFRLPEGRWFRLEVRQRLTPEPDGISSVRADGRILSWGYSPTTYGRPIERMRFGLVAIADGAQESPLDLYMTEPQTRTASVRQALPLQAALDGIIYALSPLAPSRWLVPILEKIR